MIIKCAGMAILGGLFAVSAFGQGPCFVQSSNLACVISQEYGAGPAAFSGGQPNFVRRSLNRLAAIQFTSVMNLP